MTLTKEKASLRSVMIPGGTVCVSPKTVMPERNGDDDDMPPEQAEFWSRYGDLLRFFEARSKNMSDGLQVYAFGENNCRQLGLWAVTANEEPDTQEALIGVYRGMISRFPDLPVDFLVFDADEFRHVKMPTDHRVLLGGE